MKYNAENRPIDRAPWGNVAHISILKLIQSAFEKITKFFEKSSNALKKLHVTKCLEKKY